MSGATPLSRRAFVSGALATAALVPAAGHAAIRRLSPAFDRIVAPDTVPETIASGIRWAEGPVWLPRERALLFSDPPANIVRRWSRAAGVTTFLKPSGVAEFDPQVVREPGANGLALDHQGRLLIADSGSRALVRLDLATRRRTILADRFAGKRFNSPNDLAVARSGAIWFTDPPYGLTAGDASSAKEQPVNGVYRRDPDGTIALIDGELTRPNGIALSRDERRLFVSVSDEGAPRIMVYDLDARGTARDRRVFLDAKGWPGPGLPDGMKIAADGTMFCTAPGGLYILSPEGERLGLIATGAPIANCAIGEHGRTLFLAADDRILRLPLRP